MPVGRKPDSPPNRSWFERYSRHGKQYEPNQNTSSHSSYSTRRQPMSGQSGSSGVRSYELPLEKSLRRYRQTPKNFSYIPEHKRKILDPPHNKFARGRLDVREKPPSPAIPVVPNSESLPLWLIRWQRFQRYSSIAAFLFVMASLVVYGWTVYAQQLWGQNSKRLEELQRQERQITTANEVIKNKMAKEAEKPGAGLVAPTPSRTIFVRPTSDDRKQTSEETTPNFQLPQQNHTPVGY